MVRKTRAEEENDTELTNIRRRDLMRKSALATGAAGLLGHGATGSAVADEEECTDKRDDLEEWDEYAWEDDAWTKGEECVSWFGPEEKIDHGASIIYTWSSEQASTWIHEFGVAGHAEHFTREDCGGGGRSWERTSDIQRHKATFEGKNDDDLTMSQRFPGNDHVMGAPQSLSDPDDQNAWELGYTGVAILLGTFGSPVGTALSIAGALRSFVDDTDYDEDANHYISYEWEGPTAHCGSHFVWQLVESTDESGYAKFDYIDEAFGEFPLYTRNEFEVEITDPVEDDDLEGENLSETEDVAITEGDHITTTDGDLVKVTNVTRETSEFKPDRPRLEVPIERVPQHVRERQATDAAETVTLHQFPAKVTKTSISGRRKD